MHNPIAASRISVILFSIRVKLFLAKPSAKIYQLALDQLQVKAKDAVFVDDVIENIEACEKVGMTGIHFKDSQRALKKLKALL